jgi:hypothetical protein
VDEHELDRILTRIGQEEYVPSAGLVRRTLRQLHRNRLLPLLITLSLGLHFIACLSFQVFLFSAPVTAPVRLLGQVGLAGLAVFLIAVILIMRKQVHEILCRLEAAAGCL